MKKIELTFLTVLFVIGLMAGSAQAGGHGYYGSSGHGYYGGSGHGYYGGSGHGYYGGWWPGIYWGGLALAGLPWYPYNYYPQPSTVVQQAPVYVQPQQQDDYYWYYCENPKGYYPYISSCQSGWMKVVPNANPQKAPPN
jgi:hypothetical protein